MKFLVTCFIKLLDKDDTYFDSAQKQFLNLYFFYKKAFETYKLTAKTIKNEYFKHVFSRKCDFEITK